VRIPKFVRKRLKLKREDKIVFRVYIGKEKKHILEVDIEYGKKKT